MSGTVTDITAIVDAFRYGVGIVGAGRRVVHLNSAAEQILNPTMGCASVINTHLQHVFDETDTHRQAKLVRLLETIAP